MELTKAFALLS